MSDLIVPEQRAIRPAQDANTSLLAVIARAASDPNVDITKMRELLLMQKEIAAKQAEDVFNTAMSAAQAEMRPIANDLENKQTRSSYASPAALDRALRPIYTKHGFGLSYNGGEATSPEDVRILCYVTHNGGFTRVYHYDLPKDGKGAKGGEVMTRTHAVGAAASYGMRYLKRMIFDVATGDFDTDGNDPAVETSPETQADRSLLHDWMIQFNESSSESEAREIWVRLVKVQDKVPAAAMKELRSLFSQKLRQFGGRQ